MPNRCRCSHVLSEYQLRPSGENVWANCWFGLSGIVRSCLSRQPPSVQVLWPGAVRCKRSVSIRRPRDSCGRIEGEPRQRLPAKVPDPDVHFSSCATTASFAIATAADSMRGAAPRSLPPPAGLPTRASAVPHRGVASQVDQRPILCGAKSLRHCSATTPEHRHRIAEDFEPDRTRLPEACCHCIHEMSGCRVMGCSRPHQDFPLAIPEIEHGDLRIRDRAPVMMVKSTACPPGKSP